LILDPAIPYSALDYPKRKPQPVLQQLDEFYADKTLQPGHT
jgi:hypothetical protein